MPSEQPESSDAPTAPPAVRPAAQASSVTPASTSPILPVQPIRQVVVVGLGLIGGSLARDLAVAPGIAVIGWDADAATRDAARAAGIRVADSLAECVSRQPDLIVLAVPLGDIEGVCRLLAPLVYGHTLLTDVGSVKAPVRRMFDASGLGARYVGSHPMAGTEASGFEASVTGLFRGAAWVLTADDSTRASSLLVLSEMVIRAFGSRVSVLTDRQHDEAVALVSHLPHVLAAALLGQAAVSPVRDVARSLAAGSFRDGTRVAGTNPARTLAMVTGNAAWVAPLVEQTAERLLALAAQLRSGADVGEFFAPDVGGATVGEDARAASAGPEPLPASAAHRVSVSIRLLGEAELCHLLRDAGARGRSIRSIDLEAGTIILASNGEGSTSAP